MFKCNNKDSRTTSITFFTPFSSAPIVDFQEVNVCWKVVTTANV